MRVIALENAISVRRARSDASSTAARPSEAEEAGRFIAKASESLASDACLCWNEESASKACLCVSISGAREAGSGGVEVE
jgi:hypothetical protein